MTATPLPIPDRALDSDIAVLGRKGGGKTITAKGIVERLLDLKRRVLILDPLGGWAGLRTSADGKAAGYKVAIIGGERADYPLDLALAVPLADVLARENVPTIIDLSDATKPQQQRFLLAFLHELRRVNRDAMTIVLEEADVFAPQNPMGDDSKALHGELDWLARRGRARGFRLVSICQRPARLSKDVLTQASVLVAHVLPASQDRDAVKAWVEGNGDKKLAKQVEDTLAELSTGEAWIWSTVEGARFLKRASFPMIRTLDTTATPKAGAKRVEQKTLAEVDVSKIKAALDEAKKPKAKTVAHVAGAAPGTAASVVTAIDKIRDGVLCAEATKRGYIIAPKKQFDKEQAAALKKQFDAGALAGIRQANASSAAMFATICADLAGGIRLSQKALAGVLDRLDEAAKNAAAQKNKVDPVTPVTVKPSAIKVTAPEYKTGHTIGGLATIATTSPPGTPISPGRALAAMAAPQGMTGPQAKVAGALAFWQSVGTPQPSRAQVAAVAGYSPRSSTWGQLLSSMKVAGMLDYCAGSTLKLLVDYPALSREEARNKVFGILSSKEADAVAALAAHGELSDETLATTVGYSLTSSTYGQFKSGIRVLDLIERGPEPYKLTQWAREVLS